MMNDTSSLHSELNGLQQKIVFMANAQFESPQYKKLFAVRFTRRRAQDYILQRTLWTVNRRDCWALVQGIAPMDVKKMIWDHEREELEGKPDEGIDDHYRLSVREGEAVGLSEDDFDNVMPCDGLIACGAAWLYLATHSHWLTALAASAALELSNSEEVLSNGSTSRLIGEKLQRELGIPMKAQPSNAEHAVADIAHGHLLLDVARKHVHGPADIALILDGLHRSWAIERVWKGQLADLMLASPDS